MVWLYKLYPITLSMWDVKQREVVHIWTAFKALELQLFSVNVGVWCRLLRLLGLVIWSVYVITWKLLNFFCISEKQNGWIWEHPFCIVWSSEFNRLMISLATFFQERPHRVHYNYNSLFVTECFTIYLGKQGNVFLLIRKAVWVWKNLKDILSISTGKSRKSLEADKVCPVGQESSSCSRDTHRLPLNHTAFFETNYFLLCLMEQSE